MDNRISVMMCCMFLWFADASVGHADQDAAQIMERTIKHYQNMKTFSSEGIITDDDPESGEAFNKKFAIKLAKPNFYNITIEYGSKSFTASWAVWNSGEGPHGFFSAQEGVQKFASNAEALKRAAAVLYLTPMSFFGLESIKIESSQLLGSQIIEGQDCYVLSGKSWLRSDLEYVTPLYTHQKYWISKDTGSILKISSKPDATRPRATDKEMDQWIKNSSRANRSETKKKVAALKSLHAFYEKREYQVNYTKNLINEEVPPAAFKPDVTQLGVKLPFKVAFVGLGDIRQDPAR